MTDFGLLLPTREALLGKDRPDFGPILALADQAEGEGFHSVWVGDSILARPRFEPLTTLAAVAARTRRVKLGTAVLVPAMRHPVVLANEIATVDHIAGGRLILGLGIGGTSPANAREFAALGLDLRHRAGLFEEGVTIMRRLWNEPEVTFTGRHFQLDAVRLGFPPLQPGGPPLWLAASEDRTFRRLLRLGDGWFPISASAATYAAGWERITTLATETGRDASTLQRALYTTLVIDEDETRAEHQLRQFIEAYYGVPYETMARGTGLRAGNAARCAAWLGEFIAAGVDTIVIRFGTADQTGQLARWRNDVLPRLGAGS